MKRTFFCMVILSLVVIPANARRFASGPFELAVCPAKAPESEQKYQLLPKLDEQTDADAVPLYEKAIQALPRGRTQDKQIQAWLKLPPEQLPAKQVLEMIQKHMESLELVSEATRCK